MWYRGTPGEGRGPFSNSILFPSVGTFCNSMTCFFPCRGINCITLRVTRQISLNQFPICLRKTTRFQPYPHFTIFFGLSRVCKHIILLCPFAHFSSLTFLVLEVTWDCILLLLLLPAYSKELWWKSFCCLIFQGANPCCLPHKSGKNSPFCTCLTLLLTGHIPLKKDSCVLESIMKTVALFSLHRLCVFSP